MATNVKGDRFFNATAEILTEYIDNLRITSECCFFSMCGNAEDKCIYELLRYKVDPSL